jgi:drug/metabolite transporter (DMT)-like permease
MLLAVGTFSLMDAGLKALSASYPAVQVAALRGLASLPIIVVWVATTAGFRNLVRVRFPLHLFRGLVSILMLSTFAYGLRYLPLSETYAIFFVAPLLITAFAALMLRERVEWQRWAAIAIGLAGVLIVLRPTGQGVVSLAGLAILICAIGYALSAVTVRILARTDSTQSMVFWQMTVSAAGSTLLALPRWVPVESRHWIVIVAVAITGSLGQWALTEAFRRAEASFIAPFEYTALAWGVALDWVFWQALPGRSTFLGAAVIIACGIYLIRRERVHVEAEHP